MSGGAEEPRYLQPPIVPGAMFMIEVMKRYGNRCGRAGVRAYDEGPGWMHVCFFRGGIYEYTRESVGARNLGMMKRLAKAGKGLTTFINQHRGVKEGFTRCCTGGRWVKNPRLRNKKS